MTRLAEKPASSAPTSTASSKQLGISVGKRHDNGDG